MTKSRASSHEAIPISEATHYIAEQIAVVAAMM